jgi:hypothetical protein
VHDPAGLKNVLEGRLLKTQYRGGDYRLQVKIGDGPIVEARSKTAPSGELVHVHLPIDAIHPIPQASEIGGPSENHDAAATSALTALREGIA